ncbi:sigma-70 family RNA polymerase sigma factor [Actinoplanes sp. NPDC000266]
MTNNAVAMADQHAPTLGGLSSHSVSASDSIERLTRLHTEHARSLQRFLVSLTGDRSTAEDMLQETMLRAWRHIESVPTEPENARRWLFVVARRLTIDIRRMRQSRPIEVSLAEAFDATAEDSIGMAMAAYDVCYAYTNLSDMQQHILAELHFRGSTLEEAASRLGLPVGTVKSRAHYALRSLHEILNQCRDTKPAERPV